MSGDAFDPTAPEDHPNRGNNYLSKKDVRNMVLGVAFLLVMMYPLYRLMEKNSEKARCVQNMKEIAGALNQYAAEHDDRFPPLYATGSAGEPALGAGGIPFTWISDVGGFMSERASFRCPSATDEEVAKTERIAMSDAAKEKGPIESTYGFYAPYSGYLRSIVEDPNGTIVVAETSNRGARGTLDPLPYKDAQGNVLPYDGFAIAWDNDNFEPNALTKLITRLAFPDSAGSEFPEDGPARHDIGITALNASGGLIYLKPNAARVKYNNGQLTGLWATPPIRAR